MENLLVNQAIKHHLADTGKVIEFLRPMVHRAWALSVSDPEEQVAVSMSKYLASKAVNHACRTAHNVTGQLATQWNMICKFVKTRVARRDTGDAIAHIDVIGKTYSTKNMISQWI